MPTNVHTSELGKRFAPETNALAVVVKRGTSQNQLVKKTKRSIALDPSFPVPCPFAGAPRCSTHSQNVNALPDSMVYGLATVTLSVVAWLRSLAMGLRRDVLHRQPDQCHVTCRPVTRMIRVAADEENHPLICRH